MCLWRLSPTLVMTAALMGLGLLCLPGCKRSTSGPATQQAGPMTEKDIIGTYKVELPTGITMLYLKANPNVYGFEIRWRNGGVYRSDWHGWRAYDLAKGVTPRPRGPADRPREIKCPISDSCTWPDDVLLPEGYRCNLQEDRRHRVGSSGQLPSTLLARNML